MQTERIGVYMCVHNQSRRNMKTGNRKPKTFFCRNTKMEMGFQSRIHKLQQLQD